MMATEKRLIDANEALRMMRNSKQDNPYSGTLCGVAWDMAHDCAISCVDADACKVDAVEVVHGSWVNVVNLGAGNCYGFCSVCGTDQPASSATALRIYHKYCRWCGAKMDGGADNG